MERAKRILLAMAAAAASLPLSACISWTVEPPLDYVPQGWMPGEPEAAVEIEPFADARPSFGLIGRYLNQGIEIRYLVRPEQMSRWVTDAVAAELEASGIQALTGTEPAPGGLRLKGRILGVVYVHSAFHRRGTVRVELTLEKDGATVLRRAYTRPGAAPWHTLSHSRACAESLDEALRVLLQHALPEFVDRIKSGEGQTAGQILLNAPTPIPNGRQ